ncbi:hypothetical protein QBC34DRAFT_470235, partial [Podospora aff. communis PSN243]
LVPIRPADSIAPAIAPLPRNVLLQRRNFRGLLLNVPVLPRDFLLLLIDLLIPLPDLDRLLADNGSFPLRSHIRMLQLFPHLPQLQPVGPAVPLDRLDRVLELHDADTVACSFLHCLVPRVLSIGEFEPLLGRVRGTHELQSVNAVEVHFVLVAQVVEVGKGGKLHNLGGAVAVAASTVACDQPHRRWDIRVFVVRCTIDDFATGSRHLDIKMQVGSMGGTWLRKGGSVGC